jgi:hypothetical protein
MLKEFLVQRTFYSILLKSIYESTNLFIMSGILIVLFERKKLNKRSIKCELVVAKFIITEIDCINIFS